jgi:hypothetical protein
MTLVLFVIASESLNITKSIYCTDIIRVVATSYTAGRDVISIVIHCAA